MMHTFLTDDQPSTASTNPNSNFLEEKAFKSRKVLLFGSITDAVAAETVRRLLALAAESDAAIEMLVSSPGGHVESGDAIHDIVRYINAPVTMIGTGWVGSAATHVYLSVPLERRVCLPNTRFLIHQPSGGAGGRATDIAIQAQEVVRIKERIAGVIARETKKTLARVLTDIDKDYWMNAQEAVAYGLVHRIIERQSDLK